MSCRSRSLRRSSSTSAAAKRKDNPKIIEAVVGDLGKHHRPARTGLQIARRTVANFKLREGHDQSAAKVTLRGERMYEFCDRLFNVALAPCPRLQAALTPNGFDGRGNFSLRPEGAAHLPRDRIR